MARSPIADRIAGWRLVGWAAILLCAMFSLILASAGAGEEGVRMAIRATARSSLALFSLAFSASSLWRLRPGAATRWLLDNRRYLGVSFAVSHALHLTAIVWFARIDPETFAREVDPTALVFGGFAYVVVAAMAATSFDTTAAWLGARAWRRLHGFGVWYLWFIFTITLLPAATLSFGYFLLASVPLVLLSVRIAAAVRAPRRAGSPA
ncbi:MAG: hypothetical protein ACREQ9_12360 [Candidatus Binatia bacterium]